jgi:hypothetical protein
MDGTLGSNAKRSVSGQLRRLFDAADGLGQDRAWPRVSGLLLAADSFRRPTDTSPPQRRHGPLRLRCRGLGSKGSEDSVQFKSGTPDRLTSAIRCAGRRVPQLPRWPLSMNGLAPLPSE